MKTKLLTTFLFFIATSTQLQARPSLGGLDQKLNLLLSRVNSLAEANTQAVCPSNAPTRYVDNGDGTVCDHQTGLMWEKKNTPFSDGVADPDNPRDMDNTYTFSRIFDLQVAALPDGTIFTDFLARLNGELASVDNPAQQFAGYNDWRLPTMTELMTISNCALVGTCSGGVIVITNPVLGPTQPGRYWSSTTEARNQFKALTYDYGSNTVIAPTKSLFEYVRAVRGGNRPETVIVPASTPGPAIPPGPIVPIAPPPTVGPAPTPGPLTPLNP